MDLRHNLCYDSLITQQSEDNMNKNLNQEIYKFICKTGNCSENRIPCDETIDHMITEAEHGNEMAIFYLAEWYYVSKKLNIHSPKERLASLFG